MRKDLQPRFGELTNEIARLYATHFTEQELKDILAFYTSPAGKKMLSEQPRRRQRQSEVRAGLGKYIVRPGDCEDAR